LLLDQQPSLSHGLHRPSQSVMSAETMRDALEIIAQKDFEITRLKSELVDFEMLVQVLEGEIERLKAQSRYFYPSAQI